MSRTTEPRDGIEVTGPVVLPSGLREVLIPGGGDALVRAFAYTCWGEQAAHAEVRSKITRAVRTRPEKYKLFTKEEVLARTKGWDLQGKALPLEVASVMANVYKVDIVFHLAGSFPILFKAEVTTRPEVNLILKDGVHVNATESCIEIALLQEGVPELRLGPGGSVAELARWQAEDETIEFLRKAIREGWTEDKRELKEVANKEGLALDSVVMKNELAIVEGLVTVEIQQNVQMPPIRVPLLPNEFAPMIVENAHRQLSHVGGKKIEDYMKSYYHFQNMQEVISQVVRGCMPCKMAKQGHGENRAKPRPIYASKPYELVALDLAELPRTVRGNRYIFLAVDAFSRRAAAFPIGDKSAATVAEKFEFCFLPTCVVMPARILSDNGGEFQNELFAELLRKYGMKHETIAPGYPQSNGGVERLVGTIKSLLRTVCLEGGEWDERLPDVVYSYNNTKHSSTGWRPVEVFLGHAARIVWPKRKKVGSHKAFNVGDLVLKK